MAIYRVQVMDEQQRRHIVDTECATPQYRVPFHHYRDAVQHLPVIRIPIDLPIYRMANLRTKTRQIKHARQNHLELNWFIANQENNAAQQQQHELLLELSKLGQGRTVTPIYDVLQQEGQTEEILITCNGVVVNGNRRLAAMRELFAADARTHARLSHANAMVLPPEAQEQDLKIIELRLQMRRETKLPYDWVDAALGVRDMHNAGHQSDEIASLMHLDDPSEIDQIISRLDEAELYLSDYLGRPQDYDLVYESEQMFINWERALRGPLRNQPNAVREGARAIAHVLTQQSRTLGVRVHDFRDAFGGDAAEVLNRLAAANAQELAPAAAHQAQDDIFSQVAEAPGAATRVLPLLTNLERSGEVSEQIAEIHRNIVDERVDVRRGQEALRAMRRVRTIINNIDLTRAEPATLPEIGELAEEVSNQAERLATAVNRRA